MSTLTLVTRLSGLHYHATTMQATYCLEQLGEIGEATLIYIAIACMLLQCTLSRGGLHIKGGGLTHL